MTLEVISSKPNYYTTDDAFIQIASLLDNQQSENTAFVTSDRILL